MTRGVRAGAAAGIAGFTTFLLIHHVWIAPIWFIAPIGLGIALLGGAAVGAAYVDLAPHLPGRPWTAAVVAGLVAVTLLPAIVIGQISGPIMVMDAAGAGSLLVPAPDAAAMVVGSFVAVAITGSCLGALIGRQRHAAGTMAVAASVIALGPGHNIPLLGGTAAVGEELLIVAAVLAVASIVLVEGHARWQRPA